ncbi:hypothetical protein [Nocardioides sp.]|uniref:hypothetical protein n=1 Tax=Nocardioides sp. TaxID=35761 RepID=UPI0035133F4B
MGAKLIAGPRRGHRSRRPLGLMAPVALLALGAVAFSGCGVSDATAIRPSLAFEVAGTSYTLDEVNDLVTDACAYYATLAEDGAPATEVTTRSALRLQVVQTLAGEVAVKALLADTGASLVDGYDEQLASNEQGLATVPEAQRDAMRTLSESSIYSQAGTIGLGQALLEQEGTAPATDPADPTAALQAGQTRGAQAIAAWFTDADVVLNPVLGIALTDGAFTAADTGVAVKVGEDTPAEDLPASERCG